MAWCTQLAKTMVKFMLNAILAHASIQYKSSPYNTALVGHSFIIPGHPASRMFTFLPCVSPFTHLDDVLIAGLAFGHCWNIQDNSCHLYGDDLHRDGNCPSCEDGCIDDFCILKDDKGGHVLLSGMWSHHLLLMSSFLQDIQEGLFEMLLSFARMLEPREFFPTWCSTAVVATSHAVRDYGIRKSALQGTSLG